MAVYEYASSPNTTYTCSLSIALMPSPFLMLKSTVLETTGVSQTSSLPLLWPSATPTGTSNMSGRRSLLVHMGLRAPPPSRYAAASCSEKRDKVVFSRVIINEQGMVVRREEDQNVQFPLCLIAGPRQITWTRGDQGDNE